MNEFQSSYDIVHGKGWTHIGIHVEKGTISLSKDEEVVLQGKMLKGDSHISQIKFKIEIPGAFFYVKHHAGKSEMIQITTTSLSKHSSPVKVLVPPSKSSTLSMPVTLLKGQKVCFSITYYNENGVMKVRVLKGKNTIHNTELKVSILENVASYWSVEKLNLASGRKVASKKSVPQLDFWIWKFHFAN
jgi:hypothetical protein